MINYIGEAEKYFPECVKTLLVGEAPPPSGKTYFYVPKKMSDNIPIRIDKSLPATIFHHYFKTRPTTEDKYAFFLEQLKMMGIFLIDICDEPVKVRDNPDGLKRIISEIPNLRKKIASLGINIADENIIFFLARRDYKKFLKQEFPSSRFIEWVDFRVSHEDCD